MPTTHDLAELRFRLRAARAGHPFIITTSGSTETPKRVALTWPALVAAAQASAERIGSGNWLLSLPTDYIAGAMVDVRAQLAGAKTRPHGAESFAAAASQLAAPRYVSLVPAQLASLLADPASARALAGFAAVLIGGQRMPAELRAAAEVAGVRVIATYGSTETAGGCVYDGRPLPGVQLRVDEDDRLWIAGPMLADGYLDADGTPDTRRTDAAFVLHEGARWYRTDDRAVLHEDEQGVRLEVLGRIDEVIISGGLKLDLAEVQRFLDNTLGADVALAVPAPSERWGQSLTIWRFGGKIDQSDAELSGQLIERFGRQATPVIHREETLKRTNTGKPDRTYYVARAAS